MPKMNIRIKLEIAKILNLELECSSSEKKKEDAPDESRKSIADNRPNNSDNK